MRMDDTLAIKVVVSKESKQNLGQIGSLDVIIVFVYAMNQIKGAIDTLVSVMLFRILKQISKFNKIYLLFNSNFKNILILFLVL